MSVSAHLLDGATQVPSPNEDERPYGEVSLIVLHGISLPPAEFGGDAVQALFTNSLDTTRPGLADLAGVKVSSHLFIRRNGEVIQFVPFNRRAWHAGESSFRGRESCNDFAIGIELEGTDTLPYEDAQYHALAKICVTLMVTYSITDVVGHEHIAPGRKTDPGPAFEWQRLQRNLAQGL